MLRFALAGVAVAFAAIGVSHAQGPPATESTGPVVQSAGSAQGPSSLTPPPVAAAPAPALQNAAPIAISTAAAAAEAPAPAPLPLPAAAPSAAPPSVPQSFGSYSFEVAANLITRLCETAGASAVPAAAAQAGLTPADPTPAVTWAMPAGVQLWPLDSVDSDVFLYAYGPDLKSCGAVIARPLPEIVAQRLRVEMGAPDRGYQVDSESQLEAGVKFTRFKSGAGRFADMLEYPAEGENPGLVKIELLPES